MSERHVADIVFGTITAICVLVPLLTAAFLTRQNLALDRDGIRVVGTVRRVSGDGGGRFLACEFALVAGERRVAERFGVDETVAPGDPCAVVYLPPDARVHFVEKNDERSRPAWLVFAAIVVGFASVHAWRTLRADASARPETRRRQSGDQDS